MQKLKPSDGKSWPLGANWDGEGVNFALFSANAEKVEVCLFDDAGVKEIARYAITENDNNIRNPTQHPIDISYATFT